MADFDWGSLGKWLTRDMGDDPSKGAAGKGLGPLGPNTQFALAGMAKALGGGGAGSKVGGMMQRYIQGIAAQDAFRKRMAQNANWQQMMVQLLGKQGQQPGQLQNAPPEGRSSLGWGFDINNPLTGQAQPSQPKGFFAENPNWWGGS